MQLRWSRAEGRKTVAGVHGEFSDHTARSRLPRLSGDESDECVNFRVGLIRDPRKQNQYPTRR